jgi:PAS domain S-box-containing protein
MRHFGLRNIDQSAPPAGASDPAPPRAAAAQIDLDALLELIPEPVVCLAADRTIREANRRATQLFACAASELTGQAVESLAAPLSRATLTRHLSAYLAASPPRPIDGGVRLAARRLDGTEIPVELTLTSVIAPEGELVAAAFRDTSARVWTELRLDKALAAQGELERQLQRSRRLESLGQLACSAAHDLNNLLAIVLDYDGFVDGAIDQTSSDTDQGRERRERVHRDLATIRRAAEQGTGLTRQLMAFGRRAATPPAAVDLNQVIMAVNRLLRLAVTRQVRMSVCVAEPLWHVTADAAALEQALLNLAVNSRDAMPHGGTCIIETENVEVDALFCRERPGLSTGPHVHLRFSDTGTGMTSEVREHAFEPYYTTKPEDLGSGLGLATVQEVVAAAGGDVAIYSQPGLGTTISILLPAAAGPTGESRPPRPRRTCAAGGTVLLVGVDMTVATAARRTLIARGYTVLTAADIAQALAIASQQPSIDLLITDLTIPGVLDEELAARLTTACPGMKTLFVSGISQSAVAEHRQFAAGTACLARPFTECGLLDAVRGILEERTGGASHRAAQSRHKHLWPPRDQVLSPAADESIRVDQAS